MNAYMLEVALGAGFILLYSYGRFNTPPTTRSSTTAFRFHLGASLYTFTILALYALLASVRPIATHLYGDARMPDLLESLSEPLLGALLLTVLLPNSPWLSEIDSLLRRKAQKVAAIPFEVRRVSQELSRLPVEWTAEHSQRTREELYRQGLEDADILFAVSDVPQYSWTRIASIMTCLKDWETDSRFVAFTLRFSSEWESLRRDYERLAPQAAKCFRFARETAGDTADARTSEMAVEYLDYFQNQTQNLLERLYDFVAHAVLDCELTVAGRKQRLACLGFQGPTTRTPDLDVLVGVFLLLFLVTLAGLALAGQFAPRRVIQMAIVISTSYLLSVLCSLTMRRNRRPSSQRSHLGRPWAAYLGAGLVAVGAASILSMGYRLVLTLANPHLWWEQGVAGLFLSAGQDFVLRGGPWLLPAFTTAFVLSFHLDNRLSESISRHQLQVIEACTQGLLTALAGFGAWWLLGNESVPLIRVLSLSSTLGLVIGATVPTTYRAFSANQDVAESQPSGLPAPSVS